VAGISWPPQLGYFEHSILAERSGIVTGFLPVSPGLVGDLHVAEEAVDLDLRCGATTRGAIPCVKGGE
jgi:hypothetical protein